MKESRSEVLNEKSRKNKMDREERAEGSKGKKNLEKRNMKRNQNTKLVLSDIGLEIQNYAKQPNIHRADTLSIYIYLAWTQALQWKRYFKSYELAIPDRKRYRMEELINQMRSKFSGGGQSQVSWSSSSFPRERRIPPQKSLSFKGEKKSSNWFQRQLSRQMSGSGSGTEDEVVAVAVAAAAFAVRNTLRDSTSATTAAMAGRAKSRKDREPQSPPPSLEPVRSSLRFSGEVRGSPENSPTTPSRDLTLQRRTTFADQLEEAEPPRAETPSPPKPLKHETPSPPKPLPSMKEPPSLGDKKIQVEPNTMRQPETPSPEPVVFPPIKQVTPSSAAAPPKPRASRGDSAADAWEKAEMERIKERYDKLSSTILSWEQDKKKKARAKLDRAESELSRKRAKALQKFKEEMEQIKEITEGARAQAEERRRNEELKTRDKANKYRATGKLPRTCFCF